MVVRIDDAVRRARYPRRARHRSAGSGDDRLDHDARAHHDRAPSAPGALARAVHRLSDSLSARSAPRARSVPVRQRSPFSQFCTAGVESANRLPAFRWPAALEAAAPRATSATLPAFIFLARVIGAVLVSNPGNGSTGGRLAGVDWRLSTGSECAYDGSLSTVVVPIRIRPGVSRPYQPAPGPALEGALRSYPRRRAPERFDGRFSEGTPACARWLFSAAGGGVAGMLPRRTARTRVDVRDPFLTASMVSPRWFSHREDSMDRSTHAVRCALRPSLAVGHWSMSGSQLP